MKGIWAVHHADAQTDTGMQVGAPGGPHHTYLLMSHPVSCETKVLATGEELAEVQAGSGFMFKAPTLLAGNLLKDTLIVQVSYTHAHTPPPHPHPPCLNSFLTYFVDMICFLIEFFPGGGGGIFNN